MFVEFDEEDNCIEISSQKTNQNKLEVGKEIFWRALVTRDGVRKYVLVSDIKKTDVDVYYLCNHIEIKKTIDENGMVTVRLKTDLEFKEDKYYKVQRKIMFATKDLMLAINSQCNGNQMGVDSNLSIFTQENMKEWFTFWGRVSYGGHDLSQYTMEQVNETLFGERPSIPIKYKHIVGRIVETEFY